MKTSKAPRPIVIKSTLVIIKNKHDNEYLVVNNDEELFNLALILLEARLRSNEYYFKPEEPEKLDYDESQIASLPVKLQRDAEKVLANYKRNLKFFEEELYTWELIQQAIKNKDGRLAWRILDSRGDYQYEQIVLEHLSSPDDYSKRWI